MCTNIAKVFNFHSNMTRCAEMSFSSMGTHLSDNNCTALPSCMHILSLGFNSNVAMLFCLYFIEY